MYKQPLEVFYRKGVLKISEFCEIFKSALFTEHL